MSLEEHKGSLEPPPRLRETMRDNMQEALAIYIYVFFEVKYAAPSRGLCSNQNAIKIQLCTVNRSKVSPCAHVAMARVE